jgi:hydrogenase-4 component F
MFPVAVHLSLVLRLGLAIPSWLANWFDAATRLIAGSGLL